MFTKNVSILYGRVGKDLELKQSNGGSWVTFSIATERSKKNTDGTWTNITHWHNITVFGKQAETCAKHLKQGSRVMVQGAYIYEEGEGGKRFYKVIADDVTLVDYQKTEGSSQGNQASSQSAGAGRKTQSAAATTGAVTDEDIPF